MSLPLWLSLVSFVYHNLTEQESMFCIKWGSLRFCTVCAKMLSYVQLVCWHHKTTQSLLKGPYHFSTHINLLSCKVYLWVRLYHKYNGQHLIWVCVLFSKHIQYMWCGFYEKMERDVSTEKGRWINTRAKQEREMRGTKEERAVQFAPQENILRRETSSWLPVARQASFAWEPISCKWLTEWSVCVCVSALGVVVQRGLGLFCLLWEERNAQVKHSEQDA